MTPKIKIAIAGTIVTLAIAGAWYLNLSGPPLIISNRSITLEVQNDFPACLEITPDEINRTLPDGVIIKNNCGDELTIDDLILIHNDRPIASTELKVTLLQKEDYDAFNFQEEAQQCETSFKKKHGKLRACGPFPVAAGVTMKLSGKYAAQRLKVKGHFKDGISRRMNLRLYLTGSNCPPMPTVSIFT